MRNSISGRFAAVGALLLLAAFAARAQDQHEQAMQAAMADGMTTAVGVAASGGVINPIGALLATAMKAVTLHRASTLPEAEQPAAYAAASSMWMGGTVSNVCITAVFLTGGGFAPACLAMGAAWGLKAWDDTEPERRFWERCAILREFAQLQKIDCVYAPASRMALAKEAPAHATPTAAKTRHATPVATLILTPTPEAATPAAPAARPPDAEAP